MDGNNETLYFSNSKRLQAFYSLAFSDYEGDVIGGSFLFLKHYFF